MQTVPQELIFNYAILFPSGLYYLGPKWSNAKTLRDQKRIDDPAHIGPKNRAYTYTEMRAHAVMAANPLVFARCTVVRLL